MLKNTKKGNKYHATKVIVDGIKFDSKSEARRYQELALLNKTGVISELHLQVPFLLQESFKKDGKTYRKIEYVADFTYLENGKQIVEDLKSKITQQDKVYRLKKKMLLYKYPDIEFREVLNK